MNANLASLGLPNSRAASSAWRCLFALILLATIALPVSAQDASNGTVRGYVSSSATGGSLGNVTITAEGTGLSVLSEDDGSYALRNVPAGSVTLRASYVGLQDVVARIEVPAAGAARQDFELSASRRTGGAEGEVVVLDEFSVIENREMTARAISMNEQKSATNLKNVVSFDEYGYTVDGNLGEFLKHIPGVAVDYSASVPVGVSIRGLPSSNTTISSDGALLAGGSTTAATRESSLSGVATDNISRIEVTKVPTPDMPATGLGGTINIISDSAFNRKKPLLTFTLYSTFRGDYPFKFKGYNVAMPIEGLGGANSASHILPSFTFSYLKPVNDRLAVSVSGTQNLTYIHNDTYFPAWNATSLLQLNSRYRVVPQVATIRSGQVKLDYKLTDRQKISFRYQQRKRQASQALGDFRPIYGTGATGDQHSIMGSAAGVGSIGLETGFVQRNNENRTMSLQYDFDGDVYDVDGGFSWSRSNVDNYDSATPGDLYGLVFASLAQVRLVGEGIGSDPDVAESHVPATLTGYNRAGSQIDIGDGNLYSINNVRTNDLRFSNTRRNLNLNVTRKFGDGALVALKTGIAYGYEQQKSANRALQFNFRPGQSAATRAAGNYGVVDPNLFPQLPAKAGVDIKRISPLLVTQLMKTNPEYFVLDEALAHRTRVNAAKQLKENIVAGYLRADFKFLDDRLSIIAGARYERTEDKGLGPLVDANAQYQKDANGNLILVGGNPVPITTDPLERDKRVYQELANYEEASYDGLYPSLSLGYLVTDNVVLKMAYARTIGRPNLPFIMPGASVSEEPDTTGAYTINVINTGLEPWTADNYDITVETYQLKGGTATVGVFQKDITNFFGVYRRPATADEVVKYGGLPGEDYDIVTQLNTGDAQIKGFEIGYRQSLNFLPDWARGIEAYVNYTKLELDGSALADFTGFNPETFNWGINFIRPRFAIKFDIAYQGETRRAPSGAAGNYLWAGEKTRDTISAEVQVTKNLTLYAQVYDLIQGGYVDVQKSYNPDLGTPDYARYQRIIDTGMSLTLGIRGKF